MKERKPVFRVTMPDGGTMDFIEGIFYGRINEIMRAKCVCHNPELLHEAIVGLADRAKADGIFDSNAIKALITDLSEI